MSVQLAPDIRSVMRSTDNLRFIRSLADESRNNWGLSLVTFFALSILSVEARAESVRPIPPAFRSEWNTKLQDCGTGLNDSRLVVRSKSISFYESGGPILAMIPDGNSQVTLIARLSGEGKSWVAPFQFELSSDGKRLTDVINPNPAEQMTRYRCSVQTR